MGKMGLYMEPAQEDVCTYSAQLKKATKVHSAITPLCPKWERYSDLSPEITAPDS
jgi:hypothetical protein